MFVLCTAIISRTCRRSGEVAIQGFSHISLSCLPQLARCRYVASAIGEKPAFFAAHGSSGAYRSNACSFLALAAAIPRSLA